MAEEEKPAKPVKVDSVKHGQEFNFKGVLIKLVEINQLKHPWGPSTYILAYKLIDTRSRPVFTSPVAHLFLLNNSDVKGEMQKVVDLYEQTRESIFNVKLPVVEEKP